MINPLYEDFPDFVESGGRKYGIVTDFREWIRFSDMIKDRSLTDGEKLYLMAEWLTETPEKITVELVEAVIAFFRADALNPDPFRNAA